MSILLFMGDYSNESNIVDKVSEYLPSSLRFMRWHGFPFCCLPNTFQGKYLVELDLFGSNIVQLWEDGEEKVLHKLRFLIIRYSKLRTFDLRLAPSLEQLTILECRDLVELHIPAHSSNLKKLILNRCYDLVYLQMPAESPKLEEVNLSHSKLTNLHLGNTPNLETLILEGCNDLVELQMPAESLKLKCLDLTDSKLKNLHLGNTPNLEMLILKGCNDLVELQMPESLKLQELYLSHSKLKTLHLGNTPNLERLRLKGCNDLVELQMPESLKLQEPYLSHSKLRTLNLGLTPNLERLNLENCTNLENVSRSICSLRGLRKLTLEGSIPEVPRDLDQLDCLEELTFSSTEITYLPDSICKLKHLKSLELISCWLLEKLPEDIGRLESLEELILTNSKLLQDIPNSICKMKYINKLGLGSCIRVVELPEDIGCLEGLIELDIVGTGVTRLPQSIFRLRGLRIVGSIRLIDTYGLLLKRQRTKRQRTDADDIFYFLFRSNYDETVCYI